MALSRSLSRVALSLLVALAIVQPPATLAQPASGGELVWAEGQEPDTLDPQKTSTAVTGALMRLVGDTLVTKDLKGNYIPALARSWTVSGDGLVWTFQLRTDVKFHDGNPLTAEAVKASIERALAPETKSPIAGALFGPVASVQTAGNAGVTIKLKEPFAPFLDNLTDPRAMIVSPQATSELGDRFGRSPIGTGAFKFQEWRSADRIIFARNPDYRWAPSYAHAGPAFVDRIVVRIMPESAAQVAAFERGELAILGIPPTDVRRLQKMNKYVIFSYLRKGVGLFMEFNVGREPFSDGRVRRAVNHAVEKNSVLQIGLEGLGEVAYGPLPPSIWGYWDGVKSYAPRYDPTKAKALLAEAGWRPGPTGALEKDGKPFSFILYTAPIDSWTRSAQIVQAQLRAFGIAMEIQTFEFGTLLSKLKAGEHPAEFMGYTYTSPDILQVWFHSANIGTGLTFSHNSDPKLDALIVASRRETDQTKRLAIYRDIQKYIIDQALWVPLWTNTNYTAVLPTVQGAKIHPDGFVVVNDITLK